MKKSEYSKYLEHICNVGSVGTYLEGSPEQCMAACDGIPECGGFVYDTSWCVFRNKECKDNIEIRYMLATLYVKN